MESARGPARAEKNVIRSCRKGVRRSLTATISTHACASYSRSVVSVLSWGTWWLLIVQRLNVQRETFVVTFFLWFRRGG